MLNVYHCLQEQATIIFHRTYSKYNFIHILLLHQGYRKNGFQRIYVSYRKVGFQRIYVSYRKAGFQSIYVLAVGNKSNHYIIDIENICLWKMNLIASNLWRGILGTTLITATISHQYDHMKITSSYASNYYVLLMSYSSGKGLEWDKGGSKLDSKVTVN